MSTVSGQALFGRKRSLAGSPWAGHCHLEDSAGQGGRLLTYAWALVDLPGSHHQAQMKDL